MNQYDSNNPFAQIIEGKLPCDKVYESEHTIAFHDIHPATPVHVLVIPKGQYISFQSFMDNASEVEIQDYFSSISEITLKLNLVSKGYRLITNHGKHAGQTVFHFHTHILGGTEISDNLI